MSTSKVRPEHRAAEPLQFRAVGLDVAQPGGVAVARHHRAQQLRGPGPAADPGVLAGGVLTFGLRGVELALATLAAEHRKFDADLAQRAGSIFVALAQRLGRFGGIGQFGGHRVGRRGRQLVGQFGDPPLRGCSPLARARPPPTRRSSSLTDARSWASRSVAASSSARWVSSLFWKTVARVDNSASAAVRRRPRSGGEPRIRPSRPREPPRPRRVRRGRRRCPSRQRSGSAG